MTGTVEARRKAIDANRRAWALLDRADRSEAETDAMIAAAHESLTAWAIAGGPVEAQRGNWLVARVYIDAGEAEAANTFARRTLDLTEAHRAALADFDLAFAEEIAARASALSGDRAAAKAHYDRAKALGEAIVDAGDRAEFFRQFAAEPWFEMDVA
jgi:hypothetical protein